jgi:hypothetical protein
MQLVSPIDRYVEVTFQRFCDVLAGAPLREPAADDPVLALRRLGFLVETLTAFALGHSVGRVGELVRRGCGAQVRDAVELQIAELGELPRERTTEVDPRRGDRPLAGELHTRLYARLWLAAGQARTLLQAIERTVSKVAPDRVPALTTILAVLATDDVAVLAFADQLELGWRYFTALATGAPDPTVADDPRWTRGKALWAAWARRVRCEQATRVDRHYIVAIQ